MAILIFFLKRNYLSHTARPKYADDVYQISTNNDSENRFYTRDGSLGLSNKIGNFESGKEADFVCLDSAATPLLEMRTGNCSDLSEEIFALSMLGDDRVIKETWIAGAKAYERD